jgi:hypothetical protein
MGSRIGNKCGLGASGHAPAAVTRHRRNTDLERAMDLLASWRSGVRAARYAMQ